MSPAAPHAAESRLGPPSEWFERETASHLADAEDVAKGGAGGLLVAVGLAQMILGGSAAAWWQQGAAVLLAAVGIVVLVLVVIARARRPAPSNLGRRAGLDLVRAIGGRRTRGARDVSAFEQPVHAVLRGG